MNEPRAGMSAADADCFQNYVDACAERMQLHDWYIRLAPDVLPDDARDTLMRIEIPFGRKYAEIRVHDDLRQRPADDLREDVAHELVHCHLEPVSSQAQHDLADELSPGALRVFVAGFRRNVEYAIEALSLAVAPHLPLISWPVDPIHEPCEWPDDEDDAPQWLNAEAIARLAMGADATPERSTGSPGPAGGGRLDGAAS